MIDRPKLRNDGWHRIGVVLSAIVLAIGAFAATGQSSGFWELAFGTIASAAVAYAFPMAIGWIAEGFGNKRP